MTAGRLYSIGEIAEKTGVTTRTLRYYEKLELIKPDLIKENGYRFYSEKTASIIPVIKYLQFIDFNLKEIKDFLQNDDYYSKLRSFKNAIIRTKKQIEELQYRVMVIEDWHKLIDEGVFINLLKCEIPITVKYHEKLPVIKYPMEFDFDYKNLILNVDFANYVKQNYTTITDSVMVFFPSTEKRLEDEENNRNTPIVSIQKTVKKIEEKENSSNIEEGYYLSTYHLGPHKTIKESYKRAFDYAKEKGYELFPGSIERFVLDYWTTTNEKEFVTEILILITNYNN
ncbi:MerR family transcriptional regulator [Peptoniphilus sp. MSJ-1]|uniref:MerR family transcriptional regulator n=1 Tax=Peptoniphilus ovalis TaxID=2841503 RepID=A0ABS6FF87_9FIRM|nr:MerR family transcriptional regulator [Peptoniphilus ovalis]MBU5668841.1 MerR family transcriptional regulator [Peptoniphilus ovalis]